MRKPQPVEEIAAGHQRPDPQEGLRDAGGGPYPGMFAAAHKYGYGFETLAHALLKAGFRDVLRSSYQGSADARLRIDDASAYASAQIDGRYYSLFVEATK